MYFVDDPLKNARENSPVTDKVDDHCAVDALCLKSVISLMNNIVETACEHEPDLGLMRLINLMDLYRVHLESANAPQADSSASFACINDLADSERSQKIGHASFVSFEQFVRDSQLLGRAATAATLEAGEKVATPSPLTVSANT
ncbi:MAG: hypothetical protein AB8B97_19190 [Granulosicoccus sp.]